MKHWQSDAGLSTPCKVLILHGSFIAKSERASARHRRVCYTRRQTLDFKKLESVVSCLPKASSMLFSIIERIQDNVVNLSRMLIYDRISHKSVLVSNVYFLTEYQNWWEPLLTIYVIWLIMYLRNSWIHGKISKRWKDHAYTVVQAWFNCEVRKARESLMKCEMSTNLRGRVWSTLKRSKGNPQEIIFVNYQACFLLLRHAHMSKLTSWLWISFISISHSVTRCNPLISFSNNKLCRWPPVHAWELALYTTVIATNLSPRSRELEDGAPLLGRDNQPMSQCQKSSSTAASCETRMQKPICSRDWGLTLNPTVHMGTGNSNPAGKNTQLLITRQISSLSHTSSSFQNRARTKASG